MPKIFVEPFGVEIDCQEEETVFSSARRSKIPLAGSCDGNGVCTHCVVKILKGKENLSHPSEHEVKLMKRAGLGDDERISCLAKVFGDVAITTSYW